MHTAKCTWVKCILVGDVAQVKSSVHRAPARCIRYTQNMLAEEGLIHAKQSVKQSGHKNSSLDRGGKCQGTEGVTSYCSLLLIKLEGVTHYSLLLINLEGATPITHYYSFSTPGTYKN